MKMPTKKERAIKDQPTPCDSCGRVLKNPNAAWLHSLSHDKKRRRKKSDPLAFLWRMAR